MTIDFDSEKMESLVQSLARQRTNMVLVRKIIAVDRGILSYSSAPGLEDLGRQHAQVLTGGAGSAEDVLTVCRAQAEWLAEALHSTVQALETMDGITRIQLVTGAPGPEVTSDAIPFPDRPGADYRPFTFTPPHVDGGVDSLAALAAMFSTTNTAAAERAEQTWSRAATQTGEIADELESIAGQIRNLTEGESFEQAAQTISTVAASTRVFSGNARIMERSVAQLNPINSWAQSEIAAAQAEIESIEDPEEREIAEKAWVSSFLSGSLPAEVSSAVPPISHLMESAVNGHGGHAGDGGSQTVFSDTAPAITGGTGTDAVGGTAGTIASAQAGGTDLASPDSLGTSAAGVGGGGPLAPTSGPVAVTGRGGGGVSVTGATTPGGISGHGSGAGGGVSVTGPAALGAAAGTGTGTGAGGDGTGSGVGSGRGGLVPGTVSGVSGGVRSTSGAPSGGSGRNVAGIGTGGAGHRSAAVSGARPGAGLSRAGGSGVSGGGMTPHSGVSTPPASAGAVGQSASGGTQSTSMGRGGMAGGVPMTGTAGGKQDRKKSASVLSQVERSENLEKILGPAPLTVPPVIGDWARKIPPDTPQR
ncbi:hypothetical protein OS123_03205 [Corynebacterium sp. P5875]|uniref:Uncharacterized protein n=1 Tax=Corynebacterium antarcticum TaxID=2800405 RepID=A0A9Q4CB94_9CORY|nr:hypothetical protein [Corynebacterium antarcticum]MCX7537556.1 hypothetical protein [Corynebacterium antarcticum]